jgi:TolB protein
MRIDRFQNSFCLKQLPPCKQGRFKRVFTQILLLILSVCAPISAGQEITVHVTSKQQLTPLSITSISENGSGFDKDYIASLEKIIRYDFENNGVTELVQFSKGVSLLEAQIKQKILNLKLHHAQAGIAKGIESIVLTGNLNKDRQTLHLAHDSLLSALFGKSGVASHRILYTIKTRTSDNSTQWHSDIWEADYDGANAVQITRENCLIVTPTFIPSTHAYHCPHIR